MRHYPHWKSTHRAAFYGLIMMVLLIGVAGREAFLNTQGAPIASANISTL
jgi:hypothetical protein